ncbi:MAG: hypothetical protein RIC56_07960 [Pseudomonadales bacterium]
MFLGLLTVTLPGALAIAAEPAAGTSRSATVNPFGDRSDAELTALAADWDALDRHQRRALLTEMKLRMARQGEGKGVIHIRTERRYGRLIRQSDGRVIRIETQVVHVRPLDPDAPPLESRGARQGFGVGFEQRVARRAASTPGSVPAPVNDTGSPHTTAGSEATLPAMDALQQSLDVDPLPPAPLPIYQVADPAP